MLGNAAANKKWEEELFLKQNVDVETEKENEKLREKHRIHLIVADLEKQLKDAKSSGGEPLSAEQILSRLRTEIQAGGG